MLSTKISNKILKVLKGVEVFYVGGCVRDHYLGVDPKDYDFVVVGSSPEDMLSRGFKVHGIEHSVFVHPDKDLRGFEFSLARIEKKDGKGYKGFEFDYKDVSLEEDLARRDLTMNAMAMRVGSSTIIDPFDARKDIDNGLLVHVSEAFAEDPVRVLRLARFSARYDWTPAERTLELCRQMVAQGELDHLTPERVAIELMKALSEPHPQNFLRVIWTTNALSVVFPEIDLYGIPQPAEHHPEVDTGVHLEMVLEQAAKLADGNLLTMYGALVHDVGKKLTPADVLPQHLEHEKVGIEVARNFARRLRLPKDFEEFGALVSELHTFVHRSMDMRGGKIVKALSKLDGKGKDRFFRFVDSLTAAAEADARGRLGLEDRPYPQAQFVREAAKSFQAVKPRQDIIEALKVADKSEKKALGDKLRAALHQDRAEAIASTKRA